MTYDSDENTPAELAGVQLKGEYLKEFVTLLEERGDMFRQMREAQIKQMLGSKKHDSLDEAEFVRGLIDLNRQVIDGITSKSGLKSQGALTHGIDVNDLYDIVSRATGVDPKTVDSNSVLAMVNDADSSDPIALEQNRQAHSRAMVEAVVENCINAFSMCAAVQEHREKEFIDRAVGYLAPMVPQFKKALKDNPDISDLQRDILSAGIVTEMVPILRTLEWHRKRGSLLLPLEEEMFLGPDKGRGKICGMIGTFREGLAIVNQADMKTEAGKQKLRRIEKDMLVFLSKELGVPPPLPEMGRAY